MNEMKAILDILLDLKNEIKEVKENMDNRFNQVERRFDEANKRFDRIETSVNGIYDQVAATTERVYNLETK
ncbi:hypothetical protein EDD58_1147 [Hazenella coriacea]|uniref:Uncharacterized protein n=2 Tax=Hazenella coriacea TaxID=1179467 RepID=A0A4V2UUP8_9BACL|nr:hypothetical protein EDD58_1147 [Hazenella coriacea]